MRRPAAAAADANPSVTVVLPTPPFWFRIASVRRTSCMVDVAARRAVGRLGGLGTRSRSHGAIPIRTSPSHTHGVQVECPAMSTL